MSYSGTLGSCRTQHRFGVPALISEAVEEPWIELASYLLPGTSPNTIYRVSKCHIADLCHVHVTCSVAGVQHRVPIVTEVECFLLPHERSGWMVKQSQAVLQQANNNWRALLSSRLPTRGFETFSPANSSELDAAGLCKAGKAEFSPVLATTGDTWAHSHKCSACPDLCLVNAHRFTHKSLQASKIRSTDGDIIPKFRVWVSESSLFLLPIPLSGSSRAILQAGTTRNISTCELLDRNIRGIAIDQQTPQDQLRVIESESSRELEDTVVIRRGMAYPLRRRTSVPERNGCVPVFVCVIFFVTGIMVGGAAGVVIGTQSAMRAQIESMNTGRDP